MRTGIVSADKFNPARLWFWQKPDHIHGLEVGGLVRCVVLYPDNRSPLPKLPDAYTACARIVKKIGEPFEIQPCKCSQCMYFRSKHGPNMVQRIEFTDP